MEEIIKALRDLVAEMYRDLHGAYGADAYEGQYEAQIQALAGAIEGREAPPMNEQETNLQALVLWREWFAKGGNPFISNDWDGDEPGYTCFFCGEFEASPQRPEHKQDCIYVRAKRLVTPSAPGSS